MTKDMTSPTDQAGGTTVAMAVLNAIQNLSLIHI